MANLILSADVWEMTDEKTGKTNTGVTVYFINSYREDTQDTLGFKPSKVSATLEQFKKLKANSLPALYDIDFSTKPGAQGKVTVVIQDVKFIKAIELFKKA